MINIQQKHKEHKSPRAVPKKADIYLMSHDKYNQNKLYNTNL